MNRLARRLAPASRLVSRVAASRRLVSTLALAMLTLPLAAPRAAFGADDTPDAYAYRLPLRSGSQPFQRLVLPAAVYEHLAHADLRDLRVFNAAGEVVPYAIVPPAPLAPQVARHALEAYPLRTDTAARDVGDLALSLRASNGRVTLDVRSRDGRPVTGTRVAGYVLDASGVDAPLAALVVTPAGEADVNARVRIDASDDLATWRGVARDAPLLRLRVGGRVLARDRVELNGLRAKYLRIAGADGDTLPEIATVEAEVGTAAPAPALPVREVAGAYADDHAFEYDAGGLFDVAEASLRLAAPNTIVPAQISVRQDARAPWRHVADGVFYRIGEGKDELRSPPLAVRGAPFRYWRVELDPRSGVTSASPPTLLLGWQAAEIVFPARGAAPFELAFGRRDAAPGALPIGTLVPGFDASRAMPADAGRATAEATPQVANRSALGTAVDFRRAALWAVLIVTVIVLGVLGVRLLREPQPRRDAR